MLKILLIDDNQSIREMINAYLEGDEYEIFLAPDAKTGRQYLAEQKPQVILIDIMLPDADGIELCREFRASTLCPIIMISEKKEVETKVKSLAYGADDYLCKPFSLKELEARILAQLRGRAMKTSEGFSLERERAPFINLDEEKRCIYIQGNSVEITYSEFEIAKLLMRSPGRVFTREEIINVIRSDDVSVNDRSIDVHITHLRKKISARAVKTNVIKTVWGIGYKYVLENSK